MFWVGLPDERPSIVSDCCHLRSPMSPSPSKPTARRRPFAVLPLDQFLSRSSPRKRSTVTIPLQLQDMSLLPSPFPSSSTATASARPLATLYEAPTSSRTRRASRDASLGLVSSPRARAMVDEDDTDAISTTNDALGGDDEPDALGLHSSPRRLFDAFVAASRANPTDNPAALRKKTSTSSLSAAHFIAERSHMPPPASPRATGSPRTRLARPREPSPPSACTLPSDFSHVANSQLTRLNANADWSFYQDEEDESAVGIPLASESAASAPSPVATEESDDAMPVDKENTAPSPRRARSASIHPITSPPASGPATAPETAREIAPTLPHTPPRPASPSLPLFSPAIIGVVDASHFADSGATSFFAAAGTGSTSFATTEVTASLLPEVGIARKKRRSDEAGHGIPLP